VYYPSLFFLTVKRQEVRNVQPLRFPWAVARMSFVIYLEHNATTRILPEVLQAMMPYLTTGWGNPSSAAPSKLSS
jgi:hypothetical protein